MVLIIGIFFRFANIDKKVFWHDEAYTALHISGYRENLAKIWTGSVIDLPTLQKFQKVNSDKNVVDTVISLATIDPHHPPFYYVLTRVWVQLFGDSVASLRMPSAIISLFVLPLAYWFCWELFQSSLIAWLAVTFFAVSPFQILYAQEAREYSLSIVMILLVNLTFLLAIRRNKIISWAIYSLSLTASYYTSIFAIPVAIAHGVYTLIQNKFKLNQITINQFLAWLVSIILFAPWLRTLMKHKSLIYEVNAWTGTRPDSFKLLIKLWGFHISNNFVDIFRDDVISQIFSGINVWRNLAFPGVYIFLFSYAAYILIKTSSQRVWMLLVSLFLIPVVLLMVPDIVIGGIRSAISRYFVQWYIVIPIIFAYLIAHGISQPQRIKQRFWQGAFVVMISLSIISCVISSQADFWWNKSGLGLNTLRSTKVINQATKPLIITDLKGSNYGDMLALSHRVNPQTKFQFISESDLSTIPPGFSNIFLYNPSTALIDKFQVKYSAEAIKTLEGTILLELKPPSNY